MEELSILNPNDILFFKKNGYFIARNIYSINEIKSLRNIFDSWFDRQIWKNNWSDSESIINDIYTHEPEIAKILFNQKYFDVIKDLLGKELIFLPECAIHKNRFIDWHKDTTSQEKEGHDFHKGDKNCFLQCAIYLQDNGVNGGGLTVIPGTQKNEDRFLAFHRPNILNRIYLKILKMLNHSVHRNIEKNENVIDLDTRTGDILLFDLRIDHRSTFCRSKDNNHKTKYAVFNTFGNVHSNIKKYQDFLRSRPEPYYRFINQHILPDVVYSKAIEYGVEVYY
ncbi:MAG: phytanoyl-CoA dioxygenase family protein [Saprospiraceae bacterium]